MPWTEDEKKYGYRFTSGANADEWRESLGEEVGGPINIHRQSWVGTVIGHRLPPSVSDIVVTLRGLKTAGCSSGFSVFLLF